jgi:hypothetical protein
LAKCPVWVAVNDSFVSAVEIISEDVIVGEVKLLANPVNAKAVMVGVSILQGESKVMHIWAKFSYMIHTAVLPARVSRASRASRARASRASYLWRTYFSTDFIFVYKPKRN